MDGCMPDDKTALRAWIKRMRERGPDAFPDTDLGLMDAIERVLDQDARRDWPTSVHNQYLESLDIRDKIQETVDTLQEQKGYLVRLLEEAMEWIERPVADQEDAAQFLYFEEQVKKLLYTG